MPSDNFNRGDNLSLGVNWNESNSEIGTAALQILNNRLRCQVDNGDSGAVWWNGNFPSDQMSELQFIESDAGRSGPAVRLSPNVSPNFSGYVCRVRTVGADTIAIVRYDNDTPVNIGNQLAIVTFVLKRNNRVRLRATGSTLEVLVNDAVILTTTDATYTTGNPGIETTRFLADGATGAQTWDNWTSTEPVPATGFSGSQYRRRTRYRPWIIW